MVTDGMKLIWSTDESGQSLLGKRKAGEVN